MTNKGSDNFLPSQKPNKVIPNGTVDPSYVPEFLSSTRSMGVADSDFELTYAPQLIHQVSPYDPTDRVQQITIFYKSCKEWLLKYADILSEDEGAGYAILALLNSYFETIAQLQKAKIKNRKKETEELYLYGVREVFKEELKNAPPEVLVILYKKVRCSIAHRLLAGKNVMLSGERAEPIAWEFDQGRNPLVIINPNLWLKRVYQHLEKYVDELKKDDELYKKFASQIKRGR